MKIEITIKYGTSLSRSVTYLVENNWSLQELHMMILKIQKLIEFDKQKET